MTGYQNGTVPEYDLSMFEQHPRATNTAAAPKRKPAVETHEKKPPLKLVENKNERRVQKDTRFTGMRSVIIVLFAAIFFFSLGIQINAGVCKFELNKQIDNMKQQIAEAENETIRLNNELNSITTIEKIDYYARNVLGMTKSEPYQIKCIDLTDGDTVIFNGNTAVVPDIFGPEQ